MTLLSYKLALTSYLTGIYAESWFSWLWGEFQKTSTKRRKQTKEKQRIRGKSNNDNMHHWF